MRQATLALMLIAVTMTCAAAESRVDTTIKLKVPSQVSARSGSAPAPVLVLENVELGSGDEAVMIEVLGPPDKSRKRPFLGSAATVAPSPARMTLVVPLNAAGAQLMQGRTEVSLILRAPRKVKVQRAYFDMEK